MNCSDIRQKLAQPVSSGGEAKLDPLLKEHMQGCELCRHYYSDLQLNRLLQHIDVEGPTPEFFEQSINKAVALSHRTAGRQRVISSMAAAVLVFALAIGFFTLRNDGTDVTETVQHEVQMPVNQRRDISIIIDSDRPRPETTIKVSLAENLRLQGYGDTTELSWDAALSKGENVIQLPLILQGEDGGYVEVSYQAGSDRGAVRIAVNKV